MEFFEEHKKQIMLAVTAILFVAILVTYGKKTNATFVENALGFVITPVQDLTTNVGNWFGSKIDWIRNKDNLAEENKQLKEQLKLDESLTDYSKISAHVLSRTPSSWQNQVIISKGSFAGVTKNAAVLSRKGLVGRVVEVNKTNSKVELLTTQNDSANRFAVQLESDGEVINGLITGYDKQKNQLIMGQITSKKKIKKNTEVITSGMGGNTPKGLLIGKVVKTTDDDDGLATKVYIEPAADMTDLNVVTVAKRAD